MVGEYEKIMERFQKDGDATAGRMVAESFADLIRGIGSVLLKSQALFFGFNSKNSKKYTYSLF